MTGVSAVRERTRRSGITASGLQRARFDWTGSHRLLMAVSEQLLTAGGREALPGVAHAVCSSKGGAEGSIRPAPAARGGASQI